MSDQSTTGNSSNSSRLCGCWSCVSMKTTVQRFPHKKGKQLLQGKENFPGILHHAVMIHKAQSSKCITWKVILAIQQTLANRLVPIS